MNVRVSKDDKELRQYNRSTEDTSSNERDMQFPHNSNESSSARQWNISRLSNEKPCEPDSGRIEDTRNVDIVDSHDQCEGSESPFACLISPISEIPPPRPNSHSALHSEHFPSTHMLRALHSMYNSDTSKFSILSDVSSKNTNDSNIYHRFRVLHPILPSSALVSFATPSSSANALLESTHLGLTGSAMPPVSDEDFVNDIPPPQAESMDLEKSTIGNSELPKNVASVHGEPFETAKTFDGNEGFMNNIITPVDEDEASTVADNDDKHNGGGQVEAATDHLIHTISPPTDRLTEYAERWQTDSGSSGSSALRSDRETDRAGRRYKRSTRENAAPLAQAREVLHALMAWDEAIRAYKALRLQPEARHHCMATGNARVRLVLHQSARLMGALSESKGGGNDRRVIMWVDAEILNGISVTVDLFRNRLNGIINNIFGHDLPDRRFVPPTSVRNNEDTNIASPTGQFQASRAVSMQSQAGFLDNTKKVVHTDTAPVDNPQWTAEPCFRAHRYRTRGAVSTTSTVINNKPALSSHSACHINESNCGCNVLSPMGWKEGEGLEINRSSVQEPVTASARRGRRGVGR